MRRKLKNKIDDLLESMSEILYSALEIMPWSFPALILIFPIMFFSAFSFVLAGFKLED